MSTALASLMDGTLLTQVKLVGDEPIARMIEIISIRDKEILVFDHKNESTFMMEYGELSEWDILR